MTRLISNSTRSRWAASTDGGTGAPAPTTELPDGVLPDGVLPDGVSSGVLAALVTWLPGPAGPRPSAAEGRRREACPSTASVLQVPKGRLWLTQTRQDARAHLCRERRSLLAWIPRRAAPPVAARRPFFSGPSRAPPPHALRMAALPVGAGLAAVSPVAVVRRSGAPRRRSPPSTSSRS